MALFWLIAVLVGVGLAMWLVNKFLPIEEPYKQITNVVVLVAVIVYVIYWFLGLAGVHGWPPF